MHGILHAYIQVRDYPHWFSDSQVSVPHSSNLTWTKQDDNVICMKMITGRLNATQ